MLYLTCTILFRVDLAHYGVSRAKDWVSVDCGTNKFILSFMTRNDVGLPHVSFLNIASNSPFTGRSFCSVRGFSLTFMNLYLCSGILHWSSSGILTSIPKSGSLLI